MRQFFIGNEFTKKVPICPSCNKSMELDDIDEDFRGKQDNYWTCEECSIGAIEKIRYGKSIKIDFNKY